MQVAAQTIGLDLVPVVPMAGPMGLLSYLDFTYEGGTTGLLNNTDSVAPTYIKAEHTVLTCSSGNDTILGTSRIDGKPIIQVVDALLGAGAGEATIADRYEGAELVKALDDHIPGFSGNADRITLLKRGR